MSESEHERHAPREDSGRQLRRPGHELGAARDRADISLDEMASRLHLTQEQVEAIERDDYKHLPAPAYIRGYLRAYAKQVGMDGDALVEEFDAIHDQADAPDLKVSHGVPDEAPSRGPVMAVLMLVVIALIGAAAWWAQQNSILSPPSFDQVVPEDTGITALDEPTTGDTQESGTATAVDPYGADEGAADAGGADTEATVSAEVEPEPEAMELAAEDPAAVVEAETGQAEAEPEAPAEAEAGTAGEIETAALDEGSQDSGPEVAEEPAQVDPEAPLATSDAELAATSAAATGPDRIEIVVDGESWLEVYDDRGRQLVYTLYSGDTPVVLNGWAPFDVFLGNSPAVTVRIDGAAVDQSPFVRSDKTARFLADSEGARRR